MATGTENGLRAGDFVAWNSQAGGSHTRKEGVIVYRGDGFHWYEHRTHEQIREHIPHAGWLSPADRDEFCKAVIERKASIRADKCSFGFVVKVSRRSKKTGNDLTPHFYCPVPSGLGRA